MNTALGIKDKLDSLYNEVLNGKQDVFEELDRIMVGILHLKDFDIQDNDEKAFVDGLIASFVEKINLTYDILDVKKDNLLTLEHLKDEFHVLEIKRFNIENNYVKGILKIVDIDSFKEHLFQFRNLLYAITISDSNLLEIAKMKSKIQHFNTEILEDEDILKQAYENSN
jgi:hypothetical protein